MQDVGQNLNPQIRGSVALPLACCTAPGLSFTFPLPPAPLLEGVTESCFVGGVKG